MISSVLYLAVYSVTQAATTSAVTAIYLGDTTSMKKALNEVKGRWFRFVLIGLWQLWSAMWAATVAVIVVTALMGYFVARSPGNIGLAATLGFLIFAIVIAGSIYGVIAYIRNSFAVPAAVMEGLKVRKAMRRSKQLAAGTKGRVFLLLLLVMMLYFVAIAIAAPIGLIVQQNKTTHILLWQSINLAIGFFTGSVVGPVGAIGLCLFYIDQRIRKEGFDIEFLIERSGPVPEMPVAVVAAPPVAVEPEAPAEASVTEQS
jgi:MFS family permease